jgi:hypothetical protein
MPNPLSSTITQTLRGFGFLGAWCTYTINPLRAVADSDVAAGTAQVARTQTRTASLILT